MNSSCIKAQSNSNVAPKDFVLDSTLEIIIVMESYFETCTVGIADHKIEPTFTGQQKQCLQYCYSVCYMTISVY